MCRTLAVHRPNSSLAPGLRPLFVTAWLHLFLNLLPAGGKREQKPLARIDDYDSLSVGSGFERRHL